MSSSLFLKNAGVDSIASYCILDSDYWTDQDIAKRYEEAERTGVELHVWRYKEIENYLVVPTAICRFITVRLGQDKEAPVLEDVQATCQRFVDSLWDETFDAMAQAVLSNDRSLGAAGANKTVREILDKRCPTPTSRYTVVSGKRLLSSISGWAQVTYGVSISAQSLARNLGTSEIPMEISHVISSIIHGKSFPRWGSRY